MSLDQHQSDDGRVFKLGWVPPPSDAGLMRANDTSIRAYRNAMGLSPVIPDSELKAVDLVTPFGTALIEYQRQYGSCTCAAATGAMMRRAVMDGWPITKLSWCQLYDKINGGHDNGSNIRDSLTQLISAGVVPMSFYNTCKFDRQGRAPDGAPVYKESVMVTVDDSDEVCAGVSARMPTEFPVCVDKPWERYDQYGFCGISNSKQGNHAIYAAGIVPGRMLGGRTGILAANSWDKTWGPFAKANPSWLGQWLAEAGSPAPKEQFPLAGCMLIDRAAIDRVASSDDGYGHGGTIVPGGGAVPGE